MSSNTSPLRRIFWLLLLAAASGAAYAWWRERSEAPAASEPPAWPPLDAPTPTDRAESPPPTPAPAPAPTEPSAAEPSATAPSATAPSAPGSDASATWVAPLDDGSCPDGYPIRANEKSGIFHVPEGRFYAITKSERCYPNAQAALDDGYRQSKS
jgi:hypothetical protein